MRNRILSLGIVALTLAASAAAYADGHVSVVIDPFGGDRHLRWSTHRLDTMPRPRSTTVAVAMVITATRASTTIEDGRSTATTTTTETVIDVDRGLVHPTTAHRHCPAKSPCLSRRHG